MTTMQHPSRGKIFNMVPSCILAIAAVSAALVFGGTATAFAGTGGTTSTKLSNGTLRFEARNRSVVSGNSTVFYGATEYDKSGGGKVYATLMMETSNALFQDTQKAVSSGQTISHSFGSKSIARYAPDCWAVGPMDADTGKY
ncbi:hypothetical protein ABZ299_35085 [Streptomyces sp. NPDC006184]|uniref:hypothetical protein n=1 Tax=Streptomyces sp. NPDC006184 TaxID=3155455 RepID=UPI0033AE6CD6